MNTTHVAHGNVDIIYRGKQDLQPQWIISLAKLESKSFLTAARVSHCPGAPVFLRKNVSLN